MRCGGKVCVVIRWTLENRSCILTIDLTGRLVFSDNLISCFVSEHEGWQIF